MVVAQLMHKGKVEASLQSMKAKAAAKQAADKQETALKKYEKYTLAAVTVCGSVTAAQKEGGFKSRIDVLMATYSYAEILLKLNIDFMASVKDAVRDGRLEVDFFWNKLKFDAAQHVLAVATHPALSPSQKNKFLEITESATLLELAQSSQWRIHKVPPQHST